MPRAFTEGEREHIRARLLVAARDAIARTGMRRTPIDPLCRAAGISKGAFYLFFESKEALWSEVLREAEAEARAALRAEVDSDAPQRLQRVLRTLFDLVAKSPVLAVLRDPEEMAWLERSLPLSVLTAARIDDDAFFSALHADLVRLGDARAEDREAFIALPLVALGVAQQGPWLGARGGPVVDLLVEALAARLSPR